MKNFVNPLLLVSSGYFSLALPTFAQDSIKIDPTKGQPGGIPANTPVQTIFTNVITIVFTVAIVLVLAYLLWGAFKWIVSGGDKEAIKSAKAMITNALIGLGLLSLSFLILRIAGYLLGIDVSNIVLPPLAQPLPIR